MPRFSFLITPLIVFSSSNMSHASGPMDDIDIDNIERLKISSDEQRQNISSAAGLLADYEIAAKKLVSSLDEEGINATQINAQANNLLALSEKTIEKTQFRLPQCGDYLGKTLELKLILQEISHETIEKDYHHDGALPKAPIECYHTKDLFVHPATVIVLVRDDPDLGQSTRGTIADEINEVLAHTEVVRQLVIY